jgi:hypothetical protein
MPVAFYPATDTERAVEKLATSPDDSLEVVQRYATGARPE